MKRINLFIFLFVAFIVEGQAQQPSSNSIHISFSQFTSIGDMERKMVTGQLPHINIQDVDNDDAEQIDSLINENQLPAHTINVDEHNAEILNKHEKVTHLDTTTNYMHHHLPKLTDSGAEYTSELTPDILYDKDHPKEIYKISVNGDYEYYDGKPLKGSKKFKKEHADGYKPITALTFFYHAKDEGIYYSRHFCA